MGFRNHTGVSYMAKRFTCHVGYAFGFIHFKETIFRRSYSASAYNGYVSGYGYGNVYTPARVKASTVFTGIGYKIL